MTDRAVPLTPIVDLGDGVPITGPAGWLEFGSCALDTSRRELWREGLLVPLQRRIYDLLLFMMQRPHRVLPKDELLRAIWGTTFLTDAVLTTAVVKLRKAIGDTDARLPMVATVRGIGYRFDADVRSSSDGPPVASLRQPPHAPHRAPTATWVDGQAAPDMKGAPGGATENRVIGLLRCVNSTGDALLDWAVTGLPWLLHIELSEDRRFHLLPIEASLAFRGPAVSDVLSAGCDALGVDVALIIELKRGSAGVEAAIRWGGSDAGAQSLHVPWLDTAHLARALAASLTGFKAVGSADVGASEHRSVDDFWQVQLARAFALEQQGQAEEALTLLRRCQAHLPRTVRQTLLEVRLLRLRHRFGDARTLADECLQQLGDSGHEAVRAQLLIERGKIGSFEFEPDLGASAFELAISLVEKHLPGTNLLTDALTNLAYVHHHKGNFKKAEAIALRSLEQAARQGDRVASVRAMLCLGHTLEHSGMPERSVALYQQCVSESERTGVPALMAAAHYIWSECCREHWRYQEALAAVLKMQALTAEGGSMTNAVLSFSSEVTILERLGRLEEASARLDDVRARLPNVAPVSQLALLRAEAMLRLRQGRQAEALKCLDEAVLFLGASDELWRQELTYWRVLALLAAGQVEEARQAYRPDADLMVPARSALVQSAIDICSGNRAEALQRLRLFWLKHRVLEENAMGLLVSLAWMLLEDGRLDEVEAINVELGQLPTDPAWVPLLLYARDLRRKAVAPDAMRWMALVSRNPGLMHRHAWLHDAGSCTAWSEGTAPHLGELYVLACF